VRRPGRQKDAKSSAEGGPLRRTWISLRYTKSSAPRQSNAVRVANGQSARRCSECAPRGGKVSVISPVSGSRARSAIGEAEAQTISEECAAGLA
jgi:hypothetical protein